MKIKHQIFSDFHGEFQPENAFDPNQPFGALKNEKRLCPVIQTEAQRLILAGDLFNYPRRFEFLAHINALPPHIEEVFGIPGNHEYYKAQHVNNVMDFYNKNLFEHSHRLVLFNRQFAHSDFANKIAYIGATLWSQIRPDQYADITYSLADFRTPGLSPSWYNAKHEYDLNHIKHYLHEFGERRKADAEWRIVVITHHCPSFQSSHPRFHSSNMNSAFCSNLEYLMEGDHAPDFWIHGHTHDSYDYEINRTRIICNPVAYPGERGNTDEYTNVVIEI